MNKYVILFLFSVFVSSVSQVLLKKSTEVKKKNILLEYFNATVIFAYGIFFISTLATIYSYKMIPLSLGAVLEASGYIYISILSYIFLNEKMSKLQITGLVCIVSGIIVFGM